MASIDRADWHYGGDFPDHLSFENGGTHIGMFINWIIDNNLIGGVHNGNSAGGIKDVRLRKITGREFLFSFCDGKFWADDLNEEGLAFTNSYYLNPDDPEEPYGQYIEDYEYTLGSGYESIYEIPNTWENYERLVKILDQRYSTWKTKF